MTGHAVAQAMAAPDEVNGPEGQAQDHDAASWDAIDWRACEDRVRRLRQRIFKATRERDWPKVRNLQKLTAPRGALSYPRFSREEFEGRFLGLMPYLELKGEGNHSMAGN
jgi:N-terminal domain of reverse transcriptase